MRGQVPPHPQSPHAPDSPGWAFGPGSGSRAIATAANPGSSGAPIGASGGTGAFLPMASVSSGVARGTATATVNAGSTIAGGFTHTGEGEAKHGHRAHFTGPELAIVCSHYDVGVIESVKEFKRGSSRAPKVAIKSSKGRYLLKRRARGKDDPQRVAFTHGLQIHLAERRFPLPRLIGTRSENNSMLEVDGRVYELFEFIPGNTYDSSLEATGDAGRALAFFHKLLAGYQPGWLPPAGTYHHASSLATQMATIPDKLAELGARSEGTEGAREVIAQLTESYAGAAARVERLGIAAWPNQIIHADWHPGNMLFKGSRVSAVLDYDAARPAPRVIDLANGALQFAITMLGEEPDRWPETLDEGRFKRFCRGYDDVPGCIVSTAEFEATPWLMVEALIVEAAIPIAATGSFARMDGLAFLRMIARKVAWLERNAARLTALVCG